MNDEEWRKRFAARLVELGYDKEFAKETAEAGDADLECNPEEAADNECSYYLRMFLLFE